MIPDESIVHYYAMSTVKFGIVLMIIFVVVGFIWYKWVKNR